MNMEILGHAYPSYHGGEEQGMAGKMWSFEAESSRSLVFWGEVEGERCLDWPSHALAFFPPTFTQGKTTPWGLSPTRSGQGKSSVSTI